MDCGGEIEGGAGSSLRATNEKRESHGCSRSNLCSFFILYRIAVIARG
jgi:hypothetical protein